MASYQPLGNVIAIIEGVLNVAIAGAKSLNAAHQTEDLEHVAAGEEAYTEYETDHAMAVSASEQSRQDIADAKAREKSKQDMMRIAGVSGAVLLALFFAGKASKK